MTDGAGNTYEYDVFLSHNSKDKPAVRALAAILVERGIRVWIDEEQLKSDKSWIPGLDTGIKASKAGIILVGVEGFGPWQKEEMWALIYNAVTSGKKVITVYLPRAPVEQIDLHAFLKTRTQIDFSKGFDEKGLDRLIRDITGEEPSSRPIRTKLSEPVIAVTRLRHGADHLFGRDNELARLDSAWYDPGTHVVTIVAWGGVGKTSLVVEWMARKAKANWEGFDRVFDWSFYSQGTREQGAASADTFIADALKFFGDEDMAQSAASPWDKGARLAQLVSQRRTLLVLDGLEPLQHPPGPQAGHLKDPALETLLKGLAQRNPGLCLVTTREGVADLAPFHDTTAPEWRLQDLPTPAGVELLKNLGVRGTEDEFKQLVKDVGGHALTLNLLGCYLAKAHKGDIRRRDRVRFEKADAKIQGGHAFKTMAAYENWLAEGGKDGLRALALLRLLGLFDRPADAGCLAALRKKPAILGVTKPLVGLDEEEWNITLSYLADCGLITVLSDKSAIDAHPLIREYFAKQLREENPDAWRSAHRRLYEHLKDSTEDKPQPTLDDLLPLYQAITHGCQAGLHQKTFDEVYYQCIAKGEEAYVVSKLGAFGAELGAVTCFFERPWSCLASGIKKSTQGWLLNAAAFRLRALGRLTEAVEPMRTSLPMVIKQKDWENAATGTNNLSELELILGDMGGGVRDAEQSASFADRSGNVFQRTMSSTTLANALHHVGRRTDAMDLFREAEAIQAKNQPGYRLLYSLQGFQYCDLLLAEAERAAWQRMLNPKSAHTGGRLPEIRNPKLEETCCEVEKRAAQTLKWATQQNFLLDIALNHLTLGRVSLYRAILKHPTIYIHHSTFQKVRQQIITAMDGLRRAGSQEFIVFGLLSRAWLRFLEGDIDGARGDLDEAWQIAERGPMPLHMADIHLHRARLFHDRKALTEARKLIEKHGYHRRDEELADAEEAAKNWPDTPPSSTR